MARTDPLQLYRCSVCPSASHTWAPDLEHQLASAPAMQSLPWTCAGQCSLPLLTGRRQPGPLDHPMLGQKLTPHPLMHIRRHRHHNAHLAQAISSNKGGARGDRQKATANQTQEGKQDKYAPGESNKSMSPPIRSHLRSRVTPGLGALSHKRLLSSLFMRADLPTLGKPMTQARTGRAFKPRSFRRRFMSRPSSLAAFITCSPSLCPAQACNLVILAAIMQPCHADDLLFSLCCSVSMQDGACEQTARPFPSALAGHDRV